MSQSPKAVGVAVITSVKYDEPNVLRGCAFFAFAIYDLLGNLNNPGGNNSSDSFRRKWRVAGRVKMEGDTPEFPFVIAYDNEAPIKAGQTSEASGFNSIGTAVTLVNRISEAPPDQAVSS